METSLAPHHHVVARDLPGGTGGVLLDLRTGAYFSLNHIGRIIWRHVEVGCTRRALIEAVRSELPEAPETLQADIDRFLEALRERDLLA